MTFSFFFFAPPPKTKLTTILQKSRALMTWVDQHKMHNSPSMRSLIARNTELVIANEEAKIVTGLGKDLLKNNQKK